MMLQDTQNTRTTQNPYISPNQGGIAPQPTNTALVNYNHITYALAVFSYFTAGLTWIIPIVMNYIKRNEARGTWLYSHFDWQIKTFWYSVFFGAIALALIFFGFGVSIFGAFAGSATVAGGSGVMGMLGLLMLAAVVLWHLYRVVRGWIALTNGKAVP